LQNQKAESTASKLNNIKRELIDLKEQLKTRIE
jgi:hypothetical protein